MEKEYGKLTLEQFGRFIRRLPEIRGQMKELPELVRSKKDRFTEIFGPDDHSWGEIYEFPYIEQMSWLLIMLGLHKPLVDGIAKSDDPQEDALNILDDDKKLDEWYEANEDKLDKKHLLWLVV